MRPQLGDDRGASVVELAMVLPVLVMLLLGSVTGGLALNTSIATADAVREGARFGATSIPGAAWGSDVVNQTVALSATELTTGEVCAVLKKGATTLHSSGACAVPEPAGPSGSAPCVVKVWARKQVVLDIGLTNFVRNVDRASVARYERPC